MKNSLAKVWDKPSLYKKIFGCLNSIFLQSNKYESEINCEEISRQLYGCIDMS